jgi:predicted MFS family arabinose efflux permease
MIATALAVGGVIGPLGAGFLAEHLGYNGFFLVFAGIAVVAAVLFLTLMPETGGAGEGGVANTKKLTEEGNMP